MPVAYPQEITEPFGINAPGGNINLPIPITTGTAGAASFDQGFPTLTMTPIASGGVAPAGQDMNGILYMITSHCAALMAGQPYLYSSDVAEKIGGYQEGVILGMTDETGLWFNTVPNNTSNPDTGGAGWVPLFAYGFEEIALSNQNVTLSAAQSKYPVVVLTGALTANVAVIFPIDLQQWLVINNTTGAFTVTCRTASGSGVAVQQGGFAEPTGVYSDGTNLWAAFAPVNATPSSVSPVGNTLALRSNAGYIYATYFNQSSNPAENPTIGSFAVQSTANDGFFRWITKAAMISQLWSKSLSTTGFSLSPDGFLVQFGSVTNGSSNTEPIDIGITFPTTFPNQCVGVFPVTNRSVASLGQAIDGSNFASSQTRSGATVTVDVSPGGVHTFQYMAIGF